MTCNLMMKQTCFEFQASGDNMRPVMCIAGRMSAGWRALPVPSVGR